MSEKPKLTPEQLSVLLKIVTKRTGRDPINLREELTSGRADGLLGALGADRDKLQALMNNQQELEALLSSSQVQAMLRELLGKG